MFVDKVTRANKERTKKLMASISFEDIQNAKKEHLKRRRIIKQNYKKSKNKEKFDSEY